MPWTSLKISPGIVRNGTRYSASGTWYDCSLVRFRDGLPERWAGWVNAYPGLNPPLGTAIPSFTYVGVCRSLHRHGTNDGVRWLSVGTSKKFYMVSGSLRYDVSPLETDTTTLAATPFATTNGSAIVTVTHNDHLHFFGSTVVIDGVDAPGVGGIPETDFNKDEGHLVTAWIDEDHYQITVAHAATSTVSAGGAGTITATFIFEAGTDDVVSASPSGWGVGFWGEGVWGTDPATAVADQMGVWTQDNWGEDLVANAASGPIFYWLASAQDDRMIDIRDIPVDYLGTGSVAADGHAPKEAQFIIISHRDRHLLAFGCDLWDGSGVGDVEPMLIRWCSQENIVNWNEADTTGTAGSLPLSNGTKFIAGIATTRETLVWSDQALYSLQYIGAPLIYVADILERWSDICGMKACCAFNGVIYWMGLGGFYAYSGRVDKMPCPIWDYIMQNINRGQMGKVYACSNQKYNEVLFYYPSKNSLENDSYVAVDVMSQVWTYGVLPRTAWLDIDAISPVIAAGFASDAEQTKMLFEHDNGSDDASVTPPVPISAFIESGPIELSSEGAYDKGDKMMFVRKIMPDVTFRNIETSVTSPQVNMILLMQDEPGSDRMDNSSSAVQRVSVVPIEQFTRNCHVRLRGRSLTMRIESDTLGSEWRMGIPRIDARTDGQR